MINHTYSEMGLIQWNWCTILAVFLVCEGLSELNIHSKKKRGGKQKCGQNYKISCLSAHSFTPPSFPPGTTQVAELVEEQQETLHPHWLPLFSFCPVKFTHYCTVAPSSSSSSSSSLSSLCLVRACGGMKQINTLWAMWAEAAHLHQTRGFYSIQTLGRIFYKQLRERGDLLT